jgi:hypothetical protein
MLPDWRFYFVIWNNLKMRFAKIDDAVLTGYYMKVGGNYRTSFFLYLVGVAMST